MAAIDVAGVADALGDGDRDTTWWYDPATGQVEMGVSPCIADDFGEDDDPSERGLMPIESERSRAAYTDMVDFADSVGEARAADLLRRARHGRGAFGRFCGTLEDFPDLRPHWTTYSRACAETRAIEWLAAEGYVDGDDADAALAIRAATLVNIGAAIGRHPRLDRSANGGPTSNAPSRRARRHAPARRAGVGDHLPGVTNSSWQVTAGTGQHWGGSVGAGIR